MQPKNKGLTVGELTIAISAILVVFFIWSGLRSKNSEKDVSLQASGKSEIAFIIPL